MRILIVDDSAAMRAFLRSLMHDLHHDTRECANGMDAVAEYQSFRPDLVLMDIRMPGMDGIEATERIRRVDEHARIAIVTEIDEPIYRITAAQAGAGGYFLKDDLITLLDFIRQIFRDAPVK